MAEAENNRISKFPFMFHGGDYNPDQWTHIPGTVDEDFRLFELANINELSVGIFAWSALEPEEDKFDFSYLDDIMERAEKNRQGNHPCHSLRGKAELDGGKVSRNQAHAIPRAGSCTNAR